ncbi:MAG: hypothetical protein HOC71_01445, partial [Candidatus Latescibacteria bacterium]|nr:hypothetical protein [Candidatus Latescibacterota bacterium]
MTEPVYNIDSISLHFRNISLPFVLLLVTAAVAFAYWYYRNTVPPVSGWMRRTMAGLRSAALVALITG